MKHLRILVLVHEDLVPPESLKGVSPERRAEIRTEYDVCHGLRDLNHEVRVLGVQSDLALIRNSSRTSRSTCSRSSTASPSTTSTS